jgi:hypothetical protein
MNLRAGLPSLHESSIDAMQALVIAVVAVAILRAFYSAFSSTWPESYFGGSAGIDPVISRTPVRYLAFRTIPVFIVLYSAGVVADRVGASRLGSILCAWVGYSLWASIPAIWKALSGRQPRIGLATYRVSGFIGTALVAGGTIVAGDRFDVYVPDGRELAFALLIAAATLASGHAARSTMGRRHEASELLRRAREEVSNSLVAPLKKAEFSDPALLLAIAYAEHVNRPPWTRTLERLLLRRGGSYGIMQVQSRRPLTDEASVDLFLAKLEEYPPLKERDWESQRKFLLHHNDDKQFADLATDFHWMLREELRALDDDNDDDGYDDDGSEDTLVFEALVAGMVVGGAGVIVISWAASVVRSFTFQRRGR